ncbi:MAG TPA: RHS repeat-associated core domain-containing protein [Pyrinomonadaceae bacterium]
MMCSAARRLNSTLGHHPHYHLPRIHRPTRLRAALLFDNQNFYANNVLVHTQAATGVIGDTLPGQNEFRVGGRQAVGQHFQGRIDEVRVYRSALAASDVAELAVASGNIRWLVTDHLGTPRMVVDQTGELDKIKRHDYLPFGEELTTQGGRTSDEGFAGDNVRQQFTGYERDDETALDFAQARYHSPTQGRFTSPDPLMASARAVDPQTWNRYAYCGNNPLNRVDPSGLDWWYDSNEEGGQTPIWHDSDPGGSWRRWDSTFSHIYQHAGTGQWVALNPNGNQAYVNSSLERVEAAFDVFTNGNTGLFSGTTGERNFVAGFSAGVSPLGILLSAVHEANGIDTSSRDYTWGLGAGAMATFGFGGGDDVVTVVISRSKHPEAAAHILEAQAAGYPSLLTLDKAGATARRAESLSGIPKISGKQLDEYPPAMFAENGGSAAVRPINPGDNMGAGASMGNQLRGVPKGTRVRIVVVP